MAIDENKSVGKEDETTKKEITKKGALETIVRSRKFCPYLASALEKRPIN